MQIFFKLNMNLDRYYSYHRPHGGLAILAAVSVRCVTHLQLFTEWKIAMTQYQVSVLREQSNHSALHFGKTQMYLGKVKVP